MSKKELESNKEIALGLSKAIMGGNWQEVDNLIADDFTYIGDGFPAMDKQAYIGYMKNVLSTAFNDMDMTFPRIIADGDIVAVDYTNAMTHVGDWYGVPATNKRIVASGQFMREVKNGKVTAEWQTTNGAGLMMALTAQE